MKESNIFIDFEIVKDSNLVELREELDKLIQLKNRIYLWSKTKSPIEMRAWCLAQVVTLPEEERIKHEECYNLRHKECLSYQEINEKTGVSTRTIGFYVSVRPDKKWTLDDWIVDYYKKDSSIYPKVDFIIDPDEKIVDRFKRISINGTVIEKL